MSLKAPLSFEYCLNKMYHCTALEDNVSVGSGKCCGWEEGMGGLERKNKETLKYGKMD